MAREIINVGAVPNDGAGDPLRTAYIKINNNFGELYSLNQTVPPTSLIGDPGDSAGMYAYNSSYFYYCFANYTGNSVIWAQVTQVGNASVQQITSGTSNVKIATANGPVTVGVQGTSNVAIFDTSGLSVAGNITGNYILGNGSLLSGIVTNPSSITNGSSNITIGSADGNANINIGGVSNVAVFSPTGAVVAGNVSATYFIGDGSLLTNLPIPGVYGNANVANYLPTYSGAITAATVSTTGNITAPYFIGNGSQLTGLPANYGNANVANYLPTYSGAITASTISASGNVTGGNVLTGGIVSATGNVAGLYFIGDGSQLTNLPIPGVYGNANVAAYLPTYTGNLNGNNITLSGTASIVGNTTINGTASITGAITGNLTGTTTGTHNGLVYSIDIRELSWDFGFILANTYTNPMQYLLNNAGNIDMGTFVSPSSLNIDIGSLAN
jgi:hypothetical protein